MNKSAVMCACNELGYAVFLLLFFGLSGYWVYYTWAVEIPEAKAMKASTHKCRQKCLPNYFSYKDGICYCDVRLKVKE